MVSTCGPYDSDGSATVCSSKPCTYLMSRLALSPCRSNRASTWASSPRSTIGCIQNDFWADGMFAVNHEPILHRHQQCFQTDRIELLHEPPHLSVPASKMISKLMVHSAQTMHLSCTNTNTVSKRTKTRFHIPTSPRSSIGCVQNDIWAYGTFNGNHAPILRQD
jgi:hypothetical protein